MQLIRTTLVDNHNYLDGYSSPMISLPELQLQRFFSYCFGHSLATSLGMFLTFVVVEISSRILQHTCRVSPRSSSISIYLLEPQSRYHV